MHDPEAIFVLVIEDSQDLAANIADYLEARGCLVDVAVDGTRRPAPWWWCRTPTSLTVSDTGKSIPGYAIAPVFILHFRDMANEGAGIGFSLVKRICDRYGWQVRLGSSEQQGTTVKVSQDYRALSIAPIFSAPSLNALDAVW
jgi:signal transduction histidine kinase